MADSSRTSGNYARATLLTATDAPAQKPAPSVRRFRPRLWPTLAAALLLPVFIAAGQWQWTKAGSKNALQQQLDARGAEPAMALPSTPVDAQSLRYRKITARGYYEPQYQILIDNRTHREQAGYHVITPLRLEGSEMRLLINRGWVPALAEHRQLPQLTTPIGPLEVVGTAVLPGTRFFTLGADSASAKTGWQSVWQNLDVAAYSKVVSFPIQPVVIELDAHSAAGGFVREWRRPDERVQTNLGYALQWWAFAATTVVLWLVVNFRRPS
ncbi:SURF1 family protein [Propionivibrio sp.]|uniref:SURF1 family protein n=1 Tax=Propionivibrio sp. TaxID=2212460 RepID=UPI00260615A5|nr:SURF1 family protein [Propionivibrio sp.]